MAWKEVQNLTVNTILPKNTEKREASKLNENKDIFQELEELKQNGRIRFKAKKAALFVKLENLILNADETTKKEIEGA